MADSVITQEMRDSVGVQSEPVTQEIEKGEIIRFARAIGDPNPLFTDEAAARKSRYGGLIAPPTFLRSVLANPPSTDLNIPYSVGLDGGSEWEYFEPVRPGDRITHTVRLAEVFERDGRMGNMLFVVREGRYVNQFGTLVATERATGIHYDPPQEA